MMTYLSSDEGIRDATRMWNLRLWACKYPLSFLARVARHLAERSAPEDIAALKTVEKIVTDHFDG